jgi:hypothetical protein
VPTTRHWPCAIVGAARIKGELGREHWVLTSYEPGATPISTSEKMAAPRHINKNVVVNTIVWKEEDG